MPQQGRKLDAGRTASVEKLCHPIGVGETVTILRIPFDRPPFIEGRAIIVGRSQAEHFYWVQFIGDPVARKRTVRPIYQSDPAPCAGVPRDFADAHPEIADFFPEADH